ncbi:unnamed protein product, partial [Brassica rapa subsp. trilocularis]
LFNSLNIPDLLGNKRVKLKPKSTASTHKSRSSFIIQAKLKMNAIKHQTLLTSFFGYVFRTLHHSIHHITLEPRLPHSVQW